MSKASRIAAALCERLATIRTAAGFNTEAGKFVFRGALNLRADQLPALVLVEGEEDVLEQKSDLLCRVRVPYTVEGHIACDPLNPNDAAHKLIADVQRGIFAPGASLDGLTSDLAYAGRTINPREDGSKLVVVQIKLLAQYALNLRDPQA